MPRIPVAENAGNIKVSGGVPEMGLQSVHASKQASAGVVNAIENVEDTFVKVRDFRQNAEASAFGLSKLNETLNLYEQDKENLNPEQYLSEIDKIGPEAAKTISGGLAKEQFMADFNKQIATAKFKIQTTNRQRELDTAKGTIEYQGQQIIDNPPSDLHDPLHNQTLLNYRLQFEKGIAVGLYTRDEANYKWNEFLGKLSKGKANYDIQADNSTTQEGSPVLKELLKGKEGNYGNLPKEEIANLIKDSKINIHRNKMNQDKTILETNTQSSLDMSKGIVDKTLTLAQIDNMRNSGVIDIETAGIFANALEQRNAESPADNTTVDYMVKLLDKDKSTGLDILKEATRLRGTKGFDDKAYGFIVQEVAKKFDREKKGLSGWDKGTTAANDAIKGIQSFVNSINGKNAGQLLTQFIERLGTGGDPQKIKSEIIEEHLNNEIANTKLTLPPQTEKMVASDGRIFEVKQENVEKALARGLKRANK